MHSSVIPDLRIRELNQRAIQSESNYVLYWMVANRRLRWNFSLDRALFWAEELRLPLLIFEALRCDYPWASDRLHQFILQGMGEHLASLDSAAGVCYFPYVEPKAGDGRGLLASLCKQAAVVVTDDFPCFFIPRMLTAASKRCPARFEAIDSNGLLPMRSTDRVFTRAHSFRRHLQKELLPHLHDTPAADPLGLKSRSKLALELPTKPAISQEILERWPAATADELDQPAKMCAGLPIDHEVYPAPITGGESAALQKLDAFLDAKLPRYADDRNQPQEEVSSGLSPYLHFGHISAHEIWAEIVKRENWDEGQVAGKATGSANGWWGMSESAEGFVDQLTTWRELGYNFCWQRDDFDQYESLPEWALQTMEEHASDERPHVYTLEEFERAETHNELWNAAQRQLVREGAIHNYLRMLWGKKILHWTDHPRTALEVMIELNNKYAVDGRNPNSYSGICWVLGRFDRVWGPEREIFGKIRYMTCDNTARKVRVKQYLQTYAADSESEPRSDRQGELF